MPKVIDLEGVFDAAVGLLAERGYEGVTVQAIAQAAGISEVTLFRRFGTKAALIAAALRDRLARSPFAEPTPTDDVRSDLIAIVQAYAQTQRAYGGAVTTLLVEAPRHPELRDAVSGLLPNMRRSADIVARHQTAGRLREGDSLGMTAQLLSPLITAGLWQRAGMPAPSPTLAAEALVDGFLDGHATRRPSTSGQRLMPNMK